MGSMSDILATAASGIAANAAWLDAIASNVANAGDQSALSKTGSTQPASGRGSYQPVTVTMSANASGGVSAQTSPMNPAYVVGYAPSAPFANAQGLVAVPNVDLATEFVNADTALASYRTNVAVFKAAEQMAKTLLDTTA